MYEKDLCSEYSDQIYELWREAELRRVYFDHRSPQIDWRQHFIQFLFNLADTYQLTYGTLHLAIYIFDIFNDNFDVETWRIHLVAYTSLRIASKLEESFTPDIQSLNSNFVSYPNNDYHTLEFAMGNLFSWEFNVPTAYTFCSYFTEHIVDEEDFDKHREYHQTIDTMKQHLSEMAFHRLKIFQFSSHMLYSMLPSKVATICLAAARQQQFIQPVWPMRLIKLTNYNWNELELEITNLFNLDIPSEDKLEAELKLIPLEPSGQPQP